MSYSSLSNGLMSYLASRSHDWLAWQIEEDSAQLKFSLLATAPGRSDSLLIEKTVTLDHSPSGLLEEVLEDISEGRGKKTSALPQPTLERTRNSLGLGSGEKDS